MATKITNNRYKSSVYLGKDENGKRIQKVFYAESADEADFLALEYKLHKRQKEQPVNLTLGEAFDQYIASKDAILSPHTIATYKTIRRNIFQELMNTKLEDINSSNFQKAINNALKINGKKGKPLSYISVKNAVTIVTSVLYFYLPEKKLKYTIKEKKKREPTTPTPENLLKIFKAAEGTDIEIAILLAAWLSLRIGEVCGLKWINIKNDYVEIKETRSYIEKQEMILPTKNETSNRKIPLPKYIKNKLNQSPKESEYVVPLSEYQIRYRFQKILKNNNIEHCRFHDLRHANATIMHQIGIPDKYAQERGGWSSDHVLKATYQHTFSEEQLKVAKKIDDFFDDLIHTNIHTNNKKS